MGKVESALLEILQRRLPPNQAAIQHAWAMQDLRMRYGGKGRYYHSFDHIEEMVDMVLHLAHHYGKILTQDQIDALVIAAIYHDVIYNARAPKGQNEADSAEYIGRILVRWDRDAAPDSFGFPSGFRFGTERLIRLTVDHIVHDPDVAGQILCDADLMRFAAPWEDFVKNNDDIRLEYAHVSDNDWQAGRSGVLMHYLLRDPFFYIVRSLIDPATLNIVRAMRELSNASRIE